MSEAKKLYKIGEAAAKGIRDGLASQCTFTEPTVPEFLRKDFIIPQGIGKALADSVTASMGIPKRCFKGSHDGLKADVVLVDELAFMQQSKDGTE